MHCRFARARRHVVAALIALTTLFVSAGLRAAEPGSNLTISLLTMGPGEHPFTKFGHSAIWVHDADDERDEIYNYGTFAFDSPTLLLDSVAGKLPYWLSVQSLRSTLRSYEQQGRSLVASELDLSPAQRDALAAALRDNARPEHRYYRYDYYRDNCATRVRDVIDRVLGGAMRRAMTEPASMSYRAHTLRLVASDPLLATGLDLAIGRETDAPVSFWDEAFLPERLHALLARTRVVREGREVPLIRSEHRLLTSELPAPSVQAPDRRGLYLLCGVSLGCLLAGLGFASRRSRAARMALGMSFLLVGLGSGLLGVALSYLTFFSAHSAAAANYNVLLLPPWTLALVTTSGPLIWGRGLAVRAWQIARWVSLSALPCSLIALVIHWLTVNAQQNAAELAFALPLWIGSSAASLLGAPDAERRTRSSSAAPLRRILN